MPNLFAASSGSPTELAIAYVEGDCQGARYQGQPFDPNSDIRYCLCPPARSKPNHVDWIGKLRNCIQCVERVLGNQSPGTLISSQMEELAGSTNSFVGYCKNSFGTADWHRKTRDLGISKSLPLVLPEAVLPGPGTGDVDGVYPV